MRIFVAVNRLAEVGARQTTALLIAALARRGMPVHVAEIASFSFQGATENQLFVSSTEIPPDSDCTSESVARLLQAPPVSGGILVQCTDAIWIRTNPGRDLERAGEHETFLHLCRAAQLAGTRVLNNPISMKFFASKASLATLAPPYRPTMLVSHDAALMTNFIRIARRECVVKPLVGSRGDSVIRLSPDDSEMSSKLERTFAGRGMIAQHFVESAMPGDKRVIVLRGRILEIDGQLAGIERRPAADDFRGNLHAGGSAHELQLTAAARKTATHAASLLLEHGIELAGVDLIEDQVIEFNVFSTGGLYDAIRFSGIDFADAIVRELF